MWESMPSFLCESSPTGQYTWYIPGLSVRVSVSLAPGWIVLVSFSIPCPSTSKACGMLPAFGMANLPVPAAMACCDSSTFHSESRTLTWAGGSTPGRDAVPSTARIGRLQCIQCLLIAVLLVKGSDSDGPKALWFCAGDPTRLAVIPPGINPRLVESFLRRRTADILRYGCSRASCS